MLCHGTLDRTWFSDIPTSPINDFTLYSKSGVLCFYSPQLYETFFSPNKLYLQIQIPLVHWQAAG